MPLPEDLGDEILHFYPHPQREKLGGFLVANFLSYFPKENGLKFVSPKTSKTSPHFPRQGKKFITWNSLWGATSGNRCEHYSENITQLNCYCTCTFAHIWGLKCLGTHRATFSKS